MKKLLVAFILGAFSMSAFAAHHSGHSKDKPPVHKKHKHHKKSKKTGQ